MVMAVVYKSLHQAFEFCFFIIAECTAIKRFIETSHFICLASSFNVAFPLVQTYGVPEL